MNFGRVESPPVKVAAPATSASDFNCHDSMKIIMMRSEMVSKIVS